MRIVFATDHQNTPSDSYIQLSEVFEGTNVEIDFFDLKDLGVCFNQSATPIDVAYIDLTHSYNTEDSRQAIDLLKDFSQTLIVDNCHKQVYRDQAKNAGALIVEPNPNARQKAIEAIKVHMP